MRVVLSASTSIPRATLLRTAGRPEAPSTPLPSRGEKREEADTSTEGWATGGPDPGRAHVHGPSCRRRRRRTRPRDQSNPRTTRLRTHAAAHPGMWGGRRGRSHPHWRQVFLLPFPSPAIAPRHDHDVSRYQRPCKAHLTSLPIRIRVCRRGRWAWEARLGVGSHHNKGDAELIPSRTARAATSIAAWPGGRRTPTAQPRDTLEMPASAMPRLDPVLACSDVLIPKPGAPGRLPFADHRTL